MGQKQFSKFSFPSKCIGTNVPNFSQKKPLKITGTDDENIIYNVNVHFK